MDDHVQLLIVGDQERVIVVGTVEAQHFRGGHLEQLHQDQLEVPGRNGGRELFRDIDEDPAEMG
eukprot:7846225-Pyramimonas_sp.AAC.1